MPERNRRAARCVDHPQRGESRRLAQGCSTQEAADLLQVSINTVKTHLKGIFDKMGYNKQSQVVIALSNSALKFV